MLTRHTLPAVISMFLISACDRGAPPAPSSLASPGLAIESVSGVAGPSGQHQHPNVELTPDMRQELAALHQLFARYHDLDKAIADGFEFVPPCVSDPALGGMGDHYSLNADIDFGRGDGTYALDKPQYLGQPGTPSFFGIPFTRNDGFGVWMFHIDTVSSQPHRMLLSKTFAQRQCCAASCSISPSTRSTANRS